jgi:hypothetical protein
MDMCVTLVSPMFMNLYAFDVHVYKCMLYKHVYMYICVKQYIIILLFH